MKFGTSDVPSANWASNVLLPALVRRQFELSRIVVFLNRNIYHMVSIDDGSSVETDPPQPWGKYPITALGREGMLEYFRNKLSWRGDSSQFDPGD